MTRIKNKCAVFHSSFILRAKEKRAKAFFVFTLGKQLLKKIRTDPATNSNKNSKKYGL